MAEFIFQGPLADNPLPEVLQKIHYYKVPGVLKVSRDDGSKQIFISGGEIIFATSSYSPDRLGEFLLDRARITQAQYDLSVERMRVTGKRQGTVLVEAGILTPQDLFETVKEQVMAIVWSLFDWVEGEVTFKVGKFKDDEVIKLSLDTRAAILRGIKGITDPKRVVKWLGRKEDVFETSDNALLLLPSLPLTAEDRHVFRLVDGQRTLLDVIRSAASDSGTTAKILYALYILGLIRRRESVIKVTVSPPQRVP
jgi:hypothetical protein